MKTLKYFLFAVIIAWCIGLSSCAKQNDYRSFQNGKEIVYTGKVDSVVAYPGKNRIKLSWLLISDPKISSVKVYWNNRNDSAISLITRKPGIDTVSLMLTNMKEGNYTFEIFTFDKDGNKSVKVVKTGVVYGDVYEQTLLNRPLIDVSWKVGGNTYINWGDSDTTTCIGVKVKYSDNAGKSHTIIVPNSSSSTELIDFNPTTIIEYTTLYKPVKLAIDTLYAPLQTKGIDGILLKNQGYPFIGANVAGRWGDLADWTSNIASKNHNGVGGFDNLNTTTKGYLSFEYWGTPSITNGKIYQTLTLPAGSYNFVVNISSINNPLEAAYVAVSAGNTLPDISDIAKAMGSFKLTSNVLNGKQATVSFTLTQNTEISLGFIVTMVVTNESSLRVSMVRLLKTN